MPSNNQIKRIHAACHSQFAASTLGWAAITARHPAVIETLHSHHCDEQQTERGDDLSSSSLSNERCSARDAKLIHGPLKTLIDSAFRNVERPGDFFGGQSLGN